MLYAAWPLKLVFVHPGQALGLPSSATGRWIVFQEITDVFVEKVHSRASSVEGHFARLAFAVRFFGRRAEAVVASDVPTAALRMAPGAQPVDVVVQPVHRRMSDV